MPKKNFNSVLTVTIALFLIIININNTFANDMKTTGYREPEKKIVNIIDTPNTPQMSVSPAGGIALMIEYTSMLTLEDLAEPLAKLAGIRILTRFNIKKRNYFVQSIKILDLKTNKFKEKI